MHGEHLIPVGGVDVLDRRGARNAGVVDENIEVAEHLSGRGEQRLNRGRVADVGFKRNGLAAGLSDLGAQDFGLRGSPGVGVIHRHRSAFSREGFGDSGTDAAIGAGDQRRAAGETRHAYKIPRITVLGRKDSSNPMPWGGGYPMRRTMRSSLRLIQMRTLPPPSR